MSDAAAERTVNERWSDQRFTTELESIFWMASRWVRSHLNRRVSGDPGCDWLTWFLGSYAATRRWLRGRRRFLVLGCGTGWLERRLAEWPAVGAIDAQDVAEGAVQAAAAKARDLGLRQIRYQVANLDRDVLPARAYDVVMAHSVIHHVEKLERALDQIARSLRPDGVLALNEYVGPARLQYSDRALGIVNDVMARLPARYRRSAVHDGVYPHRDRPDLEHLLRVDPSESVRSDEILRLVEERFDVLERFELGGAVLQPLLYDLVQNFDDDDPYDAAILRTLCTLEELLVDGGALASDYVFLVARPRAGRARRAARARRGEGGGTLVEGAARPPVAAAERVALPGWRVAAAVVEHDNRLATGNPACDWVTFVVAWLRAHGLRAGEPVLLLGDIWLRAALEHHLGNVEVAAPEALEDLAASRAGRYGAAFGSGAVWSAGGAGAPALLERVRALLRPGGHLVANEVQGVADSALRAAGALGGALLSADGGTPLAAPPESARRDVVAEIAAVFGRDRGALVEVLPCAGTVLAPLLESAAQPLLALREAAAWSTDDALLPLLCYAEERLVRDGLVAASHVVAIARR